MESKPIKARLCLSCLTFGLWGILFALLVLYIGFDAGYKNGSLFLGVLGLVGFLFFSCITLPILFRTAFRYPVIFADQNGIKFKSAFSSGFIHWNEIKRIWAADYGRPKYVVITPINKERYISTQSIFYRGLLRYISKQRLPVCMILVDCKEKSNVHNEIAKALNHFKKSLSENNLDYLKTKPNLTHHSSGTPKGTPQFKRYR